MSTTEILSPTVQYVGNGVAKEFAYLRLSWEESEIYVYLNDTLQTNGYSVSSEDLNQGATIIFDTPPADGVIITITRVLPLQRSSHFEESGIFKAEVVNTEFDRMIAMLQQIEEIANRGLLLPITITGTKAQLPVPKAGHALLWNAEENGLENSDDEFNNIIKDTTTLANSAARSAYMAMESQKAAAISEKNAAGSATAAAGSASLAGSAANTVIEALPSIKIILPNIGDIIAAAASIRDIGVVSSYMSELNKLASLLDSETVLLHGGYSDTLNQDYEENVCGGNADETGYAENVHGGDAYDTKYNVTLLTNINICAENITAVQNAQTYVTQAADYALAAANAAADAQAAADSFGNIHGGTADIF